MPYKESNSSSNMWYSLNYGPAKFIQISTETNIPNHPADKRIQSKEVYGAFGDQLKWFEKELKIINDVI